MTFRPTLTGPKVIWAIGYPGVSHSGSGRDLISNIATQSKLFTLPNIKERKWKSVCKVCL